MNTFKDLLYKHLDKLFEKSQNTPLPLLIYEFYNKYFK